MQEKKVRALKPGWVSWNRSAVEAIRLYMEEKGIGDVSTAILTLLQAKGAEAAVKSADLEDCANALLLGLEDNEREYVHEVAKAVHGCPTWQVILSCVRKGIQEAWITGVYIYNSWEGLNTVDMGLTECKHCLHYFKPRQFGQIWCCNGCSAGKSHTEDCTVKEIRGNIGAKSRTYAMREIKEVTTGGG